MRDSVRLAGRAFGDRVNHPSDHRTETILTIKLQLDSDSNFAALLWLEFHVQCFCVSTADDIENTQNMGTIGPDEHVHQPVDESAPAHAEQPRRPRCGVEDIPSWVRPDRYRGLFIVSCQWRGNGDSAYFVLPLSRHPFDAPLHAFESTQHLFDPGVPLCLVVAVDSHFGFRREMTSAREDLHKLPNRSFQFGNSGAESTDSAFQGLNQPPEDLRGCECAVGRFGDNPRIAQLCDLFLRRTKHAELRFDLAP